MRLTPFGEAARMLRMRLDLSMKSMAEAMGISSSYLSTIEYGEKRLSQKHIDSAIEFFDGKATPEDIANLRQCAEKSKDQFSTASLSPDARVLVAAFARRLQEGGTPTPEIEAWIAKRQKENG
jgi:transcriptional regulator with XRE-family HTH domain